MKILFLADSDSPHTLRWAKGVSENDISVGIFSLHTINKRLYQDFPNISLFSLNANRKLQSKNENSLDKLIYISALRELKKVIKVFRPDIVHAHYASSYGMLGSLSGYKPLIISAWGSDIFSFPKQSFLHRNILRYNISKADFVLSTSHIMKSEIRLYTNKNIIVTPFGIDVCKFSPYEVERPFDKDAIVIGVIKTLEKNYGVEYLIEAFSLVKKKFPDKKLKLLIVGKGTKKKYLETLAKNLNLKDDILFTGYIDYDEVNNYHRMLDIAVIPSLSESFGVSALESMACCKPVIASNVGGLKEVVDNGINGLLVEPQNSEAIAIALIKMINDQKLRIEYGSKGREKVLKEYNWIDSLNLMISIYNKCNANSFERA